jgi:phenylpropionate dioxygenase-like ring-hydroxylating dioxygenase large terminal subunit
MTDIQDTPSDTSRQLLLEVARDLGKHGAAGTVPVADEKGSLVGVPCRQEFGEIKTDFSLKQFPVLERGGLIWAILERESKTDINSFLGDFGVLLEEFGFESWHVLGRSSYKGANWKLAFDAHLDFYHLPVLHRNTFGTDGSPQALYYH